MPFIHSCLQWGEFAWSGSFQSSLQKQTILWLKGFSSHWIQRSSELQSPANAKSSVCHCAVASHQWLVHCQQDDNVSSKGLFNFDKSFFLFWTSILLRLRNLWRPHLQQWCPMSSILFFHQKAVMETFEFLSLAHSGVMACPWCFTVVCSMLKLEKSCGFFRNSSFNSCKGIASNSLIWNSFVFSWMTWWG